MNSSKKLERRLVLIGLGIISILTILVVYEKNQITTNQSQLADIQNKIKTQTNNNNDLKQLLAEKSGDNRLKEFAQKNGLSLNNDQIQNLKK